MFHPRLHYPPGLLCVKGGLRFLLDICKGWLYWGPSMTSVKAVGMLWTDVSPAGASASLSLTPKDRSTQPPSRHRPIPDIFFLEMF